MLLGWTSQLRPGGLGQSQTPLRVAPGHDCVVATVTQFLGRILPHSFEEPPARSITLDQAAIEQPCQSLEDLYARPTARTGAAHLAPTAPATVSAAPSLYGKVLVIGSGDYAGCSLYLLTSDQLHALTGAPFACSDNSNALGKPCDSVLWPALLTKGAPIAAPGVNLALLGTVTRTDLPGLGPVQQVTYAGMPL